MKDSLKKISEIVAEGSDLFYGKHKKLDPVMGIIDQALRKQGMKADAITIDCITLNKKIVFLLEDNKPDSIGVALGNKAGDIHSSSEYALNTLTKEDVLKIMESHFIAFT